MSDLKRSKRLLLVALAAGLLFIIIPAVLFANSLDGVNRPTDSFAGQTVPSRTPILTDTGWLPIIQNEFMPTFTPTPTSTVTPTPSPTHPPDTSGCLPNPPLEAINSTIENELATAINSYRGENGKEAYTLDDRLVQAARRHAQDMPTLSNSQINSNPHMGSDGTLAKQRINEACYETNFGTEIVVYGSSMAAVSAAMNWWTNSPVHNGLLLNDTLDDFGSTYMKDSESQYTHYWVVTFGNNSSRNNQINLFYCVYHMKDKEAHQGMSIATWQETPCND